MEIKRHEMLTIFIFTFLAVNSFSHFFPSALSEYTLSGGSTRGVIIVDASGGGDHLKIQAAVDNASAGDTIQVLPGTYNESVIISKRLDLVGSGVNATTIEGGGIGDVIHVNCDNVNISGFFINGSGWGNGDAGIEISGSENCYIGENAAMNCPKGIYLNDSDYNRVVNNSCWDNEHGIYLRLSMHNDIYENQCPSNTDAAIALFSSHSNKINNNSFSYTNQGDGVYVYYSDNNEVMNNTCSYNFNSNGIYLYSANSNSIGNNDCSENGECGIYLDQADSNIIENNSCMSNNWDYGILIHNSYYNKVLYNICNFNYYGIRLHFSDYNEVANSTCNSNEYGIYLVYSDHSEVTNNTCKDNYDGIRLFYSHHNGVKNNTCKSNSNGIYLDSSTDNEVVNNTCNENFAGIYLFSSDYNDLERNTCKENRWNGIGVSESDSNRISNNTCKKNRDDGIYLYWSHTTSISNNTCHENWDHGINVQSSSSSSIFKNTCTLNGASGIRVSSLDFNSVRNNTCKSNDDHGIEITHSDTNIVANNTCMLNSRSGIRLYCVDFNSVKKNTCKSNGDDGIFLFASFYNNVTANICEYNENGIYLYNWDYLESTHENNITNNYCNSNQQGIRLDDSDFNQLVNNTCNFNIVNGTYLLRSYNNNLDNHTCMNNTNGISLEESGACNVSNSTVRSNTKEGIIVTLCPGGNLSDNVCNDNDNGISIFSSHHINITNTICNTNTNGVTVLLSSNLLLANNSILQNDDFGILLYDSSDCTIRYNLVDGNSRRNIKLKDSSENQIDHNDFVHENLSVTLAVDEGTDNRWDDGVEGNYWSDYSHLHPDAKELGKTWDIPYEIVGGDSMDEHPLRYPVNEYFLNPIACAGPDIEVEQHQEIEFNSTGCFDYIGIENYTWMFSYNGTIQTLYGAAPVFTFHIIGTYDVVLRINSTRGRRDIDSVVITVIDIDPPVIDVPETIMIDQHDTVTFDAGNCSDNGILDSYIWTVEYDGVTYRLPGVKVLFTYHIAGDHQVTLWVNDSRNNSAEKIITVTVRDITPPVAEAGEDTFIDQYENAFLDAGESTDNVGIYEYVWSFRYNNRNWTRTGVVLLFKFSYPGTYEVFLNTSDEAGNWDVDAAFVTVRDITNPMAEAGGNLTGSRDEPVKLNGTLSEDNVCIVNYTWSFPYHGALMMLYGAEPEFIFREGGTYAVTLCVRDMAGNTDNDTTFVFVRKGEDENVKPPDDDAPDTGGNSIEGSSDVYICSALIFVAIILVVVSEYIYRRVKKRKGAKEGIGGGEEPEMIADLSDTFFAKRKDEHRKALYEDLYGEPWKPSAPKKGRKTISAMKRDGIQAPSSAIRGTIIRKKRIMKRVKSVETGRSEIAPVEVTEYIEEEDEEGEMEEEYEDELEEEIGSMDVSDTLEWGDEESDSTIWLEDEIFGNGIPEELLPDAEDEEYKKGFLEGYRKALEKLKGKEQ